MKFKFAANPTNIFNGYVGIMNEIMKRIVPYTRLTVGPAAQEMKNILTQFAKMVFVAKLQIQIMMEYQMMEIIQEIIMIILVCSAIQ